MVSGHSRAGCIGQASPSGTGSQRETVPVFTGLSPHLFHQRTLLSQFAWLLESAVMLKLWQAVHLVWKGGDVTCWEEKGRLGRWVFCPEHTDLPTSSPGLENEGVEQAAHSGPLQVTQKHSPWFAFTFPSRWLIQKGTISVRGGIWRELNGTHFTSPFSKPHSHPVRQIWALSFPEGEMIISHNIHWYHWKL